MPVIEIRSLPFESPPDMKLWLKQIAGSFSERTGIDIEHISINWSYHVNNHYIHAGRIRKYQHSSDPPVQVSLLVPEFNSQRTIQQMITMLAQAISENCAIDINSIFIHASTAANGLVFDQGSIIEW